MRRKSPPRSASPARAAPPPTAAEPAAAPAAAPKRPPGGGKKKAEAPAEEPAAKKAKGKAPAEEPAAKKAKGKGKGKEAEPPSAPPAAPSAAPSAGGGRVRKPDRAVPEGGDYTVHEDYDVKLNQTNIEGGSNNNKFYIIQVLESGGKFFTWNRWGRVGENGQHKLEGYPDLSAAIKGFEKKFKATAVPMAPPP